MSSAADIEKKYSVEFAGSHDLTIGLVFPGLAQDNTKSIPIPNTSLLKEGPAAHRLAIALNT